MTNELEKGIGTEERQKLSAGSVIVKEVSIEIKKTRQNKDAKLVVFRCLHPSKQELINLSNIKIKIVQGNNETIKKDALWYNEDSKGEIDQYSNVAKLMRFYKKTSLKAFEGTSIDTEADANGYLCIKAY